jgi:flagellar basal body-associated protein FliL
MADPEGVPVQQPEPDAPAPEEASPVKGPLIPPAVVRYSILGGILAVLAVGAIFLVTDVIAPRVRSMGTAPAPSPAAEKKGEPGEVFAVSDLLVNPAGTGGRRYLKAAAAIEVSDPKALKALTLRNAQVRDLLIRDLSSRTLEELTDPTAKEEMRQSLVDELNEIAGAGTVSNIFFTEYVVQ